MPAHKRIQNWEVVKSAYVERDTRPTFDELCTEFAIPRPTIVQCAGDQGWALLRAKRTAALVERTGAHETIIAAAATQRAVTDRFSAVTLATIEAIEQQLARIDDSGAVSTGMNILNTASFAIANLARALKDAGVVGLPKALMDELEKRAPTGVDTKDYLRSAIQQINVTVNAAREGKSLEVTVEPNPVKYPTGGVHANPNTGYVDPADPVKEKKTLRSAEGTELRKLLREAEEKSKARFEAEIEDVL